MFAFFKYDLIQPLIPPPSKLQPTCWAFALVKLPGMILPQCLYYWPFLSLTSQLKCHLGRAISANHLPWKGTCYFFYHPFIPHTMNQNDELFCSGLFLVVATCCEYLLITFPLDPQLHEGRAPVCLAHCCTFRFCQRTQETRVHKILAVKINEWGCPPTATMGQILAWRTKGSAPELQTFLGPPARNHLILVQRPALLHVSEQSQL